MILILINLQSDYRKMNKEFDNEIENAVNVLKNGGVLLYPTDTIWGIGCDATNFDAVEKIYQIKKREKNKSMIVLMDGIEQLIKYVKHVPFAAIDLHTKTERPVTIIYPSAINLAKNLIAEDGSIAIRIPNNEFCNQLIKVLGKPLVSTSANFSGEPSAISFGNISTDLLLKVDYIVQLYHNQILETKPSRIIKLNIDGSTQIIRT